MGKIAFLNNYFPALSATFIYREVLGLTRRGMKIRTFSIKRPELDDLPPETHELYHHTTYLLPVKPLAFVAANFYFIFRKPLAYLNLIFFLMTRKYSQPVKDRLRTLGHFAEGVWFARLVLDDREISHLHAHYLSHPCTVVFVASRLTGLPFSFTAHAFDIWFDRLFIPDKIAAASFGITCTEFGKQRIMELNNIKNANKITPIYHGIDLEKFKPPAVQANHRPFTILHVGRLHPEKSQQTIIEACRNLAADGHQFQCNIVGGGEIQNDLQNLIDEYDLNDKVTLTGRVFQEEILPYYQNADVFVLTSITENLPNVLVESLASGTPIVASNLNGIPELIKDGETGLLIRPAHPDDLTEALKQLIEDPELRLKLARQGRQLVQDKFDVEKCLDQLVELYHTKMDP